MNKNLLLILAVTSTCFATPSQQLIEKKEINMAYQAFKQILSLISPDLVYPKTTKSDLTEIENMLLTSTLNTPVINKVIKTIECANEYKVNHNNILTVIDYSLPSNEKRLWVFDLNAKKLLFNTYVSHGIKSGTLLTNYFSNKFNSKSSSIGVYTTEKTYYGRDGLSLRLDGLEIGFNDNASNRSVVMHGGWYVDENFIKKYGRPGRSWGCPALPIDQTKPIIQTIKDQSLFVVYYPSDQWFTKSKFLNCGKVSLMRHRGSEDDIKPNIEENQPRETVLFANVKSGPILVMEADNYERIFNNKAPLERMLRRQINKQEYIALSETEFEKMASSENKDNLQTLYFVIPVIKEIRGYYETQMQFVNLGKIKDLKLYNEQRKNYAIVFEGNNAVSLRRSNEFIRWLGL